ncbi:MAG: hypothetical protein A3G33_05800 [Omnitrophica bacterium RIFCSPLOWO2_12_FULL_44_17]|uniref:diguanylate cyclase n=1 Tax=Candidatus Danuiimicrobium aquiferis TaxID=1801832 RepID=A0A1G1L354_9BACT|nr:MAG: hypothetical protein A3B72_08265 [Omnitrophica bacterium RIFCSPHIGHO2_02_FULL_45_28]OGW89106.1 MAG: hypothetical protein A3E74_03250 [Omnitrophica bacterium RIFCSPHIGHO2_12_FULL_44_12]OGW99585.1 MAG: hypothetical protein A3G33_05800 [Omnitrophica bacterium RIFCSPLOWO2_12_FULL_44_17]OGX03619.1 MAG: hypothetical protein A3J12_05555 [Omnitrophica bacterium RIFCSPLOWO2_02_FULL_44_11]
MFVLMIILAAVTLASIVTVLIQKNLREKDQTQKQEQQPFHDENKHVRHEDHLTNDGREEVVAVKIDSVEFDFSRNFDMPEVRFQLALNNPSRYDIFVTKIDWEIWIHSKTSPIPIVRGSLQEAILLQPLMSRDDFLVDETLDHTAARYVSQMKGGLTTGCFFQGVIFGEIEQKPFQRSFVLRNVPYLVEEEKLLSNMYIDPTHLDPLTGLLNRRFLKDNLQSIVDVLEPDKPVSFIMLDIDNYKQVNDTLGHLVGDQVLSVVSSKIREAVGMQGFTIRYGGDEFSVILAHCNSEQAKVIAEKIRSHVAAAEFPLSQNTFRITISIGVATLKERTDCKILIQRADDMLRISKHAGKNRVTSFEETTKI